MSFQFAIDPRVNVVYVTQHGAIDYWKVIEAISELSSAIDFEPEYEVLVDLRELDCEPSADEIAGIASQLARYAEVFRKRIAVLVPVSLVPSASRVSDLASRNASISIGVFTHPDDGRVWLGID